MSQTRATVRDALAGVVTKKLPSLLFYLSDPEKRAGLRVEVRSGWIDVVDDRSARRIRLSRRNAAYVMDMINEFDYYFGSAAPISLRIRGRMQSVVDFSTPRFHLVTGFVDFPVMCPSLTEPYVTAEQYIEFAELQEGQVVIDLGSYSALTSIAFSKSVGRTGQVIALEPDPANFAAALTNIAQHKRSNDLHNIVLMNNAVAANQSTVRFSSEASMGSSAVSIVGGFRGETVEVDCLSLDDVARLRDLRRVDFVKMDIEGAEESVLAAAEDFLKRFRPRIIIEPHVVQGVLSEAAVIRILENYGYRCETITQVGVSLPLVTAVPQA